MAIILIVVAIGNPFRAQSNVEKMRDLAETIPERLNVQAEFAIESHTFYHNTWTMILRPVSSRHGTRVNT